MIKLGADDIVRPVLIGLGAAGLFGCILSCLGAGAASLSQQGDGAFGAKPGLEAFHHMRGWRHRAEESH